MRESVSQPAVETAALLDTGILLGRNQAFGVIAGRCNAAQAADIRRLREEKLYQQCTPRWNDFCARYLKMSGTQADKIIRYLEEFGPGYFELAQLTRISPQTYRAVEPSIQENALHYDGEVIELNPDNAQRLAEAVAEIRRHIPVAPRKPVEMPERIDALDQRCTKMIAEFQEISRQEPGGEYRQRFTTVLERLAQSLDRLRQEYGM